MATFANVSNHNLGVAGRFGTAGYILVGPAPQEGPSDSLGTIREPQSPLVAGVSTLSAQEAYRSSGGAINGGVVVAEWARGRPLIVRGVVGGRNRADVNLWPPSTAAWTGSWQGDGAIILKNALLYR